MGPKAKNTCGACCVLVKQIMGIFFTEQQKNYASKI